MKTNLKRILALLMASLCVAILVSCGSGGDYVDDAGTLEDMTDEETAEYLDNGIVFEEEDEDAELSFKEAAETDFLGSWEATSGNAIYKYGNVDLNIEENGKWTGNVADEDLTGTWKIDGNSMVLESELFGARLSFTEDGKLIMQEDREGEDNPENYINTVLTKKE